MDGYVRKRSSDKRYFLGFIHLSYAECIFESTGIVQIAIPFLDQLHDETDETCLLALFDGETCTVVYVCGSLDSNISCGFGEKYQMHANATGKAVLAFLPRNDFQRIMSRMEFKSYTKNTITDRRDLEKCLRIVRREGVAFNTEERYNGLNGLSCPIFEGNRKVLGAITLLGRSLDLDMEQMKEYADKLVEAAEVITWKLGGSYPQEVLDRYSRRAKQALWLR
jgi:DNA-binding IclR family transcriptional regulator